MPARGAALTLLLAPPALGQMAFTARHSDINAQSAGLFSRELTDTFEDFDRAVALDDPAASARQLSRLRPGSIFCVCQAAADSPDGTAGRGESILNVTFSLADSAAWTISGLAAAPAGSFRISLINADTRTAIFSDSLTNAPQRPLAADGLLDPGRYQLLILAQAGLPPGPGRLASGDVTFTIVPAPATMPLLILALRRPRRR